MIVQCYALSFLSLLACVYGQFIRMTICEGQTGQTMDRLIRSPNDCGKFIMCIPNTDTGVEMACPAGTLFRVDAQICDWANNVDCDDSGEDTVLPAPLTHETIEVQCQRDRSLKIPHETSCAAYYDCSTSYDDVPRFYEQHMYECEHPLLFNAETQQCDAYQNVNCGERTMEVSPCDYRANWCQSAHCAPCKDRMPSCVGKQNGLNPWPQREWTQFYMDCQDERVKDSGRCDKTQDGDIQLFSVDNNACTSIAVVPLNFGGFQPECDPDVVHGFFPDPRGRKDYYFECFQGEFSDVFQCESGAEFNQTTQLCEKKD